MTNPHNDDPFIQRVIAHADESSARYHAQILEYAMLAPGVLCVRSTYDKGEADIYFDARTWELSRMGAQVYRVPFSNEIEGIGILFGSESTEGSGHHGSIKELSEAMVFAQRNLSPRVPINWNVAPVILENRLH